MYGSANDNGRMDYLRYTAFSSDPAGGNPAGVVLDASMITIVQGEFIGRPAQHTVDIPTNPGFGISVTGTAVAID